MGTIGRLILKSRKGKSYVAGVNMDGQVVMNSITLLRKLYEKTPNPTPDQISEWYLDAIHELDLQFPFEAPSSGYSVTIDPEQRKLTVPKRISEISEDDITFHGEIEAKESLPVLEEKFNYKVEFKD